MVFVDWDRGGISLLVAHLTHCGSNICFQSATCTSFQNGTCISFQKGTWISFQTGTLTSFHTATLVGTQMGLVIFFHSGTLISFQAGTSRSSIFGFLTIFQSGTCSSFQTGTYTATVEAAAGEYTYPMGGVFLLLTCTSFHMGTETFFHLVSHASFLMVFQTCTQSSFQVSFFFHTPSGGWAYAMLRISAQLAPSSCGVQQEHRQRQKENRLDSNYYHNIHLSSFRYYRYLIDASHSSHSTFSSLLHGFLFL